MGNMRTLPANNYEQAHKRLAAISEEAARTLPREIKEGNKKYFNVICVRRLNDPRQEKYVTRYNIAALNDYNYEKLQQRFATQGYHSIILLHDPKKDDVHKAPKEFELSGAPEPKAEKPEPVHTEKPVFNPNKAKIAELKEYIEANKIPHSPTDKKKDLVVRIKEWQNKS